MRALTITVCAHGEIWRAEGIDVGFRPDVWRDRFVLLGTWQPPPTPVRVRLSQPDLDALVPVGPCRWQGIGHITSPQPFNCPECGTPYDLRTLRHPLAGSARRERILRASVAFSPEGVPFLVAERLGDEDRDLVRIGSESQAEMNFEMLDGVVEIARGERLREPSTREIFKNAMRRGWHASLPAQQAGFDVLATFADGGMIAAFAPNPPPGWQARLIIRRMGDKYSCL